MNHTTNPGITKTSAFAALSAIALLASACGSDSQSADLSSTEEIGQEVTTNVADTNSTDTEQVDVGNADATPSLQQSSADPDEPASIALTIEGVIDFETETGQFEVPAGADVLGCSSGSFAEEPLAAFVERVFSCESGERSGTFTVHFQPEMVEPGQFASTWTVEDATGDFVGIEGGGDFTGEFNDDETGADGTWTGEVSFAQAGDEVSSGNDIGADTTESADDSIDVFLSDRVERLRVPDDSGAVMAVVIDADGSTAVGLGGTHPDGAVPSPADPVRVGSITKVFTSLTLLSLVDDGVVALDDPAADHLERIAVLENVTVRDLLQHTSGIPSYTDVDTFFETVIEDPSRRWAPEEIIEVIADQEPDFIPGEKFAYSNTNYAVLGILIEELTGQPVHEVVRERVIDQAGMTTTYLAGAETGPDPVVAYTEFGDRPLTPIDFDYTAVATSAWTGGAMVSSAEDLHRLFTALYAGEIISDDLRDEMTANEGYGLGIEPWAMEDTLVGHGGFIPGSNTLVFHAPETGQTAFWMSTSDGLSFGPLVEDVAHAMVPELADEDG